MDPWHDQLKAALLDPMADLGVTAVMADGAFLAAMEQAGDGDPAVHAVLAAGKAFAGYCAAYAADVSRRSRREITEVNDGFPPDYSSPSGTSGGSCR